MAIAQLLQISTGRNDANVRTSASPLTCADNQKVIENGIAQLYHSWGSGFK